MKMAGILAYSFSGAFPLIRVKQWLLPEISEITAAGTAPDFLPDCRHVTGFPFVPFQMQK